MFISPALVLAIINSTLGSATQTAWIFRHGDEFSPKSCRIVNEADWVRNTMWMGFVILISGHFIVWILQMLCLFICVHIQCICKAPFVPYFFRATVDVDSFRQLAEQQRRRVSEISDESTRRCDLLQHTLTASHQILYETEALLKESKHVNIINW